MEGRDCDCEIDEPARSFVDNRRLLIVSYFFPPSAEVAAKPTARLVRQLRMQGWQPIIVTAKSWVTGGVDPGYAATIADDVRIVSVGSWEHPLCTHQRWKRRRANPSRDQVADASCRRSKRSSLREWLSVPDLATPWIGAAAWRCSRLIRQLKCRGLLTVSPVPSAHLVGLLLKHRYPRLFWTAQFHDPWVKNPFCTLKSKAVRRCHERLEAAVVRRCDLLATATESALEQFDETYGIRHKGVVTPNGFDREEGAIVATNPRNRRLTITHLGTIYGGRDPRPLLLAVERLLESGVIGANELRIRLVGSLEGELARDIARMAQSERLRSVCELHATVPHHEAVALLGQSDVMLLLAQGQPRQVPAKLYEYMQAGKFVLALTDGESARLIRQLGLGEVIESSDMEFLMNRILDLIRRWRAGDSLTVAPSAQLEYYSSAQVASRLSERMESMMRKGNFVRSLIC